MFIGHGDTRPPPTWKLPFTPAGLWALTVENHKATTTYRSDTGDLVVDLTDNLVTWAITAAQSAALPLGGATLYRLMQTVGDAVQTYANGRVVSCDGPVPSSQPAAVAIAGAPGLSAFQLAQAAGYSGTEAQWLASLTPSVMSYPIVAASSFTAAHGFPFNPNAWLVDSSGTKVDTDTFYAPGQVTVVFPTPFTGTLQLGA